MFSGRFKSGVLGSYEPQSMPPVLRCRYVVFWGVLSFWEFGGLKQLSILEDFLKHSLAGQG